MATDFSTLEIRADSRSVKTATTDMGKMGAASTKLGGALRTLAPALSAIISVRALGRMADEAREFGKAMGEVNTLLSDTSQLERVNKEALNLAATFGGSPTDQAKGFYQAISAGAGTAAEATSILVASNKLAIGGVTDVTTAVDGLTSIINAFGLEAADATGVSDAMFVAMKAGKTTVGELSSSVGKLAPIASSVGLSMEEMLGAVSALTTQGISTSESVNGLKAALSNVLKPTKEAGDEAERLGLNFGLAALQEEGFTGFMESVVAKSGGSKESLVKLFGSVEALNTVFALTGGASESFIQIMEDMKNKTGQTEIAVKKMRETFDQQFSELTGKISASRVVLGSFLLELASPVVSAANENYDEIMGTIRLLGSVVLVTAGFFAVQYVAAMVASTTVTGGLTTSVGLLKVAMVALSGPAGWIPAAVVAVGSLVFAYERLKTAQDDARQGAVDWISGTGGLKDLNLAVIGTENKIADLEDAIQKVGRSMSDPSDTQKFLELKREQSAAVEFLSDLTAEQTRLQDIATAAQVRAAAEAESAAASIGVLNTKTIDLRNSKNDLLGIDLRLTTAIGDQDFVMGGVILSTDAHSESVVELIAELEQEREDLGKTGRELFILTQTRGLDVEATSFEIDAIREKAGALFDEREAIRLTTEAFEEAEKDKAKALEDLERDEEKSLREREKNNERAALAMQEDWRDTRDAFADFFVDFSDNGADAFDSLAKAFESSVKRMVAQWVASGLMGMFGMGGGGPNSSGGFSLFGGGGQGGTGSLFGTASGINSGLNMAGFGGIGAVAGNAGSLFSSLTSGLTGVNSMVAPSTAAGGLASGFGSMMSQLGSFMTSPAGIAAGVLIAGKLIHDKTSDPDGFTREMGGFLSAPTPGAAGSTFGVDAFSSGFQPIGLSHGTDQASANTIIDQFRFLDDLITQATLLAGGTLDLTNATLGGFGIDGKTGTAGTLFGTTGRTTEADFNNQLNSFSKQLATHIEGLTPEAMANLMGATNAQQIVDILGDVIIANEQLAIDTAATQAEANRTFMQVGDFILDSNGALVDSDHNVVASEEEFSRIVNSMPRELRTEIETALMELKGIEEINGLLFNQTGDLVDKNGAVITSADNLSRVLSLLPDEMALSISNALSARNSDPVSGITVGPNTGNGTTSGVGPNPLSNAESLAAASLASGRATLAALTDNPTLQGFLDFGTNNPTAFATLGVRDNLIDFERITGLSISEGGLEAWGAVHAAIPNMTLEEFGAQMKGNIDASTIDGSFAGGISRVPFDGFRAELHQGERVLTASETNDMDSGAPTSGVSGMIFSILSQIIKAVNIIRRWDQNGLPAERV